jgi:hypothetical protein
MPVTPTAAPTRPKVMVATPSTEIADEAIQECFLMYGDDVQARWEVRCISSKSGDSDILASVASGGSVEWEGLRQKSPGDDRAVLDRNVLLNAWTTRF